MQIIIWASSDLINKYGTGLIKLYKNIQLNPIKLLNLFEVAFNTNLSNKKNQTHKHTKINYRKYKLVDFMSCYYLILYTMFLKI